MRRTIIAAALLTATALSTTGCGMFGGGGRLGESLEYHFEVTGTGTDKISYSYVAEDNSSYTTEEPTPALPWKLAGIAWPGEIRIDFTPTGGPATCKIIVEKKVLAEKKGEAGKPLSCVGTAKDQ
jgi:hypothetical protein